MCRNRRACMNTAASAFLCLLFPRLRLMYCLPFIALLANALSSASSTTVARYGASSRAMAGEMVAPSYASSASNEDDGSCDDASDTTNIDDDNDDNAIHVIITTTNTTN